MRLDRARCTDLMGRAEHGVLATRHPSRGVDAVPVCFAVDDRRLGIPVDRVKPKGSTDLQRTRNLDDDPRAALLCDHWDSLDWTRLWWVRATLVRVAGTSQELSTLASLLRRKYPPYQEESFAELIVFRIEGLSGWSARSQPGAAAP